MPTASTLEIASTAGRPVTTISDAPSLSALKTIASILLTICDHVKAPESNKDAASMLAERVNRAVEVLTNRARNLDGVVLGNYADDIKSLEDVLVKIATALEKSRRRNDKGWFHRDISIGNTGSVPLRDCQGVLVKLHDFDLSKHHGSLQEAPRWTGTLPFMAIGLLEAPKSEHRIGFDVEALMWSLLWIARLYDDRKVAEIPLNKHPLKNWFLYPESNLAAYKRTYLSNDPGHPFTNDFYKPLEKGIKGLAWQWSLMLWDQTKERWEHKSEEIWFSDKPYGKKGADEIQRWMEENHWNRP